MQLAAVIWVSYNFFVSQAWTAYYDPVLSIVELWPGNWEDYGGDLGQYGMGGGKAHCSDPTSFNFDWDANFLYRPTKCSVIPWGEQVQKLGNMMYIPTYIEDTYYVNGSKSEKVSYFIENVEALTIYMNHGYEVERDKRVMRGRDKGQAEDGYAGSEMEEIEGEEGQLLTIFQNEQGDRDCTIGGKKRWFKADVQNGINGSVQDFLVCAGLSGLDETNTPLLRNVVGESGKPTFRLSGMGLRLNIVYENTGLHRERDWDGAVAYVRVQKVHLWNSNFQMGYTTLPTAANVGGSGTYRHRYQYGITLEIFARGKFGFFDYGALITGLVNALVLLSLPIAVIKLCALYLCGPISKVYNRTVDAPLDISGAIYGALVRKCISGKTFKLIAGETTENPDTVEGPQLQKMFSESLLSCIKNGVLDEGEIQQMTKLVLAGLDTTKTGDINLEDWCEAASYGEAVQSTELGDLFDEHRKKGFIEQTFTDSKMQQLLNPSQISQMDRLMRYSSRYSSKKKKARAVSEKEDSPVPKEFEGVASDEKE